MRWSEFCNGRAEGCALSDLVKVRILPIAQLSPLSSISVNCGTKVWSKPSHTESSRVMNACFSIPIAVTLLTLCKPHCAC